MKIVKFQRKKAMKSKDDSVEILMTIIKILEPLNHEDRKRILACVAAFYGIVWPPDNPYEEVCDER